MATKLKNLRIRKVDFVDAGANPDAHIRLLKRKDGQTGVKCTGEENTGFWKKLVSFIGKAAGMGQEEIDSAVEEIQKADSANFRERLNEVRNRKIADEIWDICYALQSSLCSALCDDELDSASAAAAMQESLDDFQAVVTDCIRQWAEGKASNIVKLNEEVTEADLEIMKSAVTRLNETIEKTSAGKEKSVTEKPKGDGKEMEIDKSKLTPAERAFLEEIASNTAPTAAPQTTVRATDEGVQQPTEAPEGSVTKAAGTVPQKPEAEGEEDIYKGLHPAVAAELAELKKFRESTEERELSQVAKKYAVIGKKEEELVPLLKGLKAAGGSAYNDMIAILDQAVEAVEKSGLFSEIGKSGHGGGENSAETKISGIAKGYMEKDPSLSYHAAVAKAWEEHPELLSEYDEEAGF